MGTIAAAALLYSAASAAPVQKIRQEAVQPILTNQILTQLTSGAVAQGLAQRYGLRVRETLIGQPSWVVFEARSVADAVAAEKLLRGDAAVRSVENNSIIRRSRWAFTPNDPYYAYNSPAGFFGQWHLNANTSGFVSVSASQAWALDVTGDGVTIGIVDDSFETAHPDLAPGYEAALSWDFGQADSNPNPVYSSDRHGISVAGVAGARGGNAIGVTGAAPFAGLAGLRCDFVSGTVAMFTGATLHRSSGAFGDRQIEIKNHSYGIPSSYASDTSSRTALTTSADAGTIHVWSAGNARGASAEDANTAMTQASRKTITVAALGGNGKFSDYSSFGANVFVTAPSSQNFVAGITTTDRTGNSGYNTSTSDSFPDDNYTSLFGGTSSSAPLTSGVLALAKEVSPAMDVRLAKHLLARTSKVVDPWDTTATSDGGWKTNAAGFRFNPNYGFGNIHAGDLVKEARRFYSATPPVTQVIGPTTVNTALPDGNLAGITRTFYVFPRESLEEVVVRLNVTTTFRGDITAWLTSPSGTRHRLVRENSAAGGTNITNWDFTANGFWGENTAGTWSLTVADAFTGDASTWANFTVTFNYGDRVTKLGNNVLTYDNTTGAMQMTSLVLNKAFTNQALPTLSSGFTPQAVGDIDGDGRNDIVTVDSAGNIEAILMWGYSEKARLAVGTLAANQDIYAIADINADGSPDICWHNPSNNQIGYYNVLGTGLLGASVSMGLLPTNTRPIGAADSTGDGQPDITLERNAIPISVWILQLTPGGTPFGYIFGGFQVPGFTLLGVGDYNYDGQPDYIARNNSNGSMAGYRMNVLTVTHVETLTTIPAGHTAMGFAAL